MITKSTLALGFAAAVLSAGCTTHRTVVKADPTVMQASNEYFVKADPTVMQASNEYFETAAIPQCSSYGCKAFILRIKNKTDRNLEINWNKTLYVTRGQTSGGFMFEGVVYKDRNSPKSPDIVFGNGTFAKTIYPNNLVEFSSGKYGGWRNKSMPFGENGIYLTVNIDGKEITQKLITNISVTRVQQ